MALETIDLKDRKILYQLDVNCRQSNSAIGKKVGLSKQVVDYRIRKLVNAGVIFRFATVIDTYKLGFTKYKIYLSLENTNTTRLREIIEYLKNHKKTEWVATCTGKWDLIASYLAKDVYEFNEAIKELEEKFSYYLASRETTITLGVPHWRKEYLLNNKEPYPVVYQGGTAGNFTIDAIDEEILKLMVNNARMPIMEIAKRLKITPRIVHYRLKNLTKEKIILINRIFINFSQVNLIFCKAFFTFKNLTTGKYAQFFQYCNNLKNLTFLINCLGPWDVELEFEIDDFNKYHSTILDLKDKFAEIIRNYDFVIIVEDHKLDYYPGAYPVLH